MSEHTPGPWRVLDFATGNKGFFIAVVTVRENKPDGHVCDVFPFGKRVEGTVLAEHIANARLIAAAPDMLEALRAAEEFGFQGKGGNAVYDKVCAAIAKAEQRA